MRPAQLTTSAASLLCGLILLTCLGCSQENPTAPANSPTTDSTLKTSPAKEVFVETFDHQSNVGNWSFFGNPQNMVEVIEKDGGNPGAFLHSTCGQFGCLDTYAPKLRTEMGVASVFTGDYRMRNVTELGVDLATFGPELVTTGGRPLCLILHNDNGTLDDWSDDVQITYVGKVNIPMDSDNFRPYKFRIPSQSPTLPEDWQIMRGTGDPDADWEKVITEVTQVTFHYGDPFWFFMFQTWELGADNISITTEELP